MKSCDVVVVGAGVAGCTLAYELARAGVSEVVAERGAVGSGSSAVNAGGIRQQFSHETSVPAGMATVRRLGTFAEEFGVDPVESEGIWGGTGIGAGRAASRSGEGA